MKKETVPTPAVIIDDQIARANIAAFQAYCDQHEIALRPHIKTHKLPLYAIAQLEAGAVGVTCQKLSEAEVMARYGIKDILISYNLVGADKLNRLNKLAGQLDRLKVVADHTVVIDGLSEAFRGNSKGLEVLVECDTGGGRCGVGTPADAVRLAKYIDRADGLFFGGLMTYPAVGGTRDVQNFMAEAVHLLTRENLPCSVVSGGGSPDMWSAHLAPVVTEYRIGTYIYNDRSLVERGVCGWEDCALRVHTTVVSTPNPGRAIVDAGSKVLTSDLFGLEGYGHVVGRPDLTLSQLSEEHGIVHAAPHGSTGLSVGDRLEIIPNHCCVVSNMVDLVYLCHGDATLTEVYVLARGCVT